MAIAPVLELLLVEEHARHFLEEHGTVSLQVRRAVPEPPLDVAGWIGPRVEGT